MLFKLEVIESDNREDLVWANPYQGVEVLLSATPEGTKDENTAWVMHLGETVTFKALPGLVFYGRTRP